jgi:hypothetical protein
VGRECGVPIDSVSGDEDSGGDGPGGLFEDVCLGCRSEKFHLDRAGSFARYQGSLVRAIVLLKLKRWSRWRTGLRIRLAEVVRENGTVLKADLIVAVPLHKIRRRECGLRLQPGGNVVRTACGAAWTAASGHTLGEKAASAG